MTTKRRAARPKDESHLPRWHVHGVGFQGTRADVYVRAENETEAKAKGERAMRHVFTVTRDA